MENTEHTNDRSPATRITRSPSEEPSHRPVADIGLLRLGSGLVWSELVEQMNEEHEARLQQRASAALNGGIDAGISIPPEIRGDYRPDGIGAVA